MSEPEGRSSKQGGGPSIPGQPIEEAVAEVGSEAGKSLVRGLAKLGNAYVSKWITKREAMAEAARLAIETDAKIGADTTLAAARRDQELAEFEHRDALERRAVRLRIELAREQLNLEAIQLRALEYTESASDNDNPRDIDEDWLFKFADLAQKVSDEDVQSLWARALSSATMQNSPKLSAVALQTLGLFDKDIAESFKRFVAVAGRLGFVPHLPEGQTEPQQIDIGSLKDLGLVHDQVRDGAYQFGDFEFEGKKTGNSGLQLLQDHLSLTRRGSEIAKAVFSRLEDLPLSEENEQKYLQHVIQQIRQQPHIAILPRQSEGGSRVSIRLTGKDKAINNTKRVDWESSEGVQMLSRRLKKLLEWAARDYYIEIS